MLNHLRRAWLTGFAGLLFAFAPATRATVLEIPDLIVFEEPQFSGSSVDLPLRLVQEIPADALGGFILLTPDSPVPANVTIEATYDKIIKPVSPGQFGVLSIDNPFGGPLPAGTLLIWHFSPASAIGATVTVRKFISDTDNTPVSYVGTLDASLNEDTYVLGATTTITPVPEPASWILVLAGLGITSFALSRRQPS